MTLEELRLDSARNQKKGLHFIVASIFIWIAIAAIHYTSMAALSKNFYTFMAAAALLPLSFGISKLIKADFTHKSNPLTNLGLLFSLNQMLYLLIAMWVYSAVPEKFVMVLAIIFGAHLLPYSWLYKSVSYRVMSIAVSIAILIIGNLYDSFTVALVMVLFEVVFSCLLIVENKKISSGEDPVPDSQ